MGMGQRRTAGRPGAPRTRGKSEHAAVGRRGLGVVRRVRWADVLRGTGRGDLRTGLLELNATNGITRPNPRRRRCQGRCYSVSSRSQVPTTPARTDRRGAILQPAECAQLRLHLRHEGERDALLRRRFPRRRAWTSQPSCRRVSVHSTSGLVRSAGRTATRRTCGSSTATRSATTRTMPPAVFDGCDVPLPKSD